MRRRLLLTGGLLLLLTALFLALCNLWEDRRAGELAAHALYEMELRRAAEQETPPPSQSFVPSLPPDPEPEESLPAYVLDPDMEMPVTEIDGHGYIGSLDIPVLELSLPVMDAWSYPNLKLAPCRYSGSAYHNSLIVAGHDYRTHFGHLKELLPGDEIRFTDAAGNEFSYAVTELEELAPTAVGELHAGVWDLTLFTCTPGGKARLAVRCERVVWE